MEISRNAGSASSGSKYAEYCATVPWPSGKPRKRDLAGLAALAILAISVYHKQDLEMRGAMLPAEFHHHHAAASSCGATTVVQAGILPRSQQFRRCSDPRLAMWRGKRHGQRQGSRHQLAAQAQSSTAAAAGLQQQLQALDKLLVRPRST